LLRMENVPVITGAPSGSSASVVKLILPYRTWTVCLLPLFLLFWLEPWPWFGCVAWGHSRAKWLGLTQIKQRFALLGRTCGWAFSLGPVCWGIGGREAPCCCGGLNTYHPCWGACWGTLGVVVCTKPYLYGGALEGQAGALLFFLARWAMIQSSWVVAKFTSSL
jgi:hypothetical protein